MGGCLAVDWSLSVIINISVHINTMALFHLLPHRFWPATLLAEPIKGFERTAKSNPVLSTEWKKNST